MKRLFDDIHYSCSVVLLVIDSSKCVVAVLQHGIGSCRNFDDNECLNKV